MSVRSILPRWIGATWLGWILGVPFIAALALAGEAAGIVTGTTLKLAGGIR